MKKIAFVYNLRPKEIRRDDPDFELFVEVEEQPTIDSIRGAIEANGYEVIGLEANEDLYDKLRDLRGKIDLVFNFSEGISNTADREAHVPMLTEILRIPYSGPGPLAAAIILDKTRTKDVWAANGVPTPKYQLLDSPEEEIRKDLSYPMIVKPNSEGSGSGIRTDNVVRNEAELKKKMAEVYEKFNKEPVLIEEFMGGREFTVAIIGNDKDLRVLPIIELNFSAWPQGVPKIDGFDAKWVYDDPSKANSIKSVICPAEVDQKLEEEIKAVAKKAYLTVGCRDWGRVDLRMDEENKKVYALEINHPPGLMPDPKEYSKVPVAAGALGWDFKRLLGEIIGTALKRYGS